MFLSCKFHPTSGIARDLADRQNLFVNVGTLSREKLHRKLYCPRENVKSLVVRAALQSYFIQVRLEK